MLLDKIIELATDSGQSLSVLLRQCIVLAYELKNDSLKAWANQELGRNATKVFDKGLQVGTSVGTTVLTEYIKRHFGMLKG